MSFALELSQLLPADLPHRDDCIAHAARHLELIVEANQYFNLTRILDPREAAIKHVLDSVLPWRLFDGAKHIADAGSGAGFPGIPLALVLPDTRFTLLESTQKKAAFIASAAEELALANVEVLPERAEAYLANHPVDIITARAVAPLTRAIPLFAPALRKGTRVLLYKGPDAANEINEARREPKNVKWNMRVVFEYDLPDSSGSRSIVEITR
ncbi:MAG: 16S rRNA (guanine(527)-N(7))-methyltransferase RsmG [Acidobacteriota bacterium]